MNDDRWVVSIAPASAEISDPVFSVVSASIAIRVQREIGMNNNFEYESDQEALDDYMTVNWAWLIDCSQFQPGEW